MHHKKSNSDAGNSIWHVTSNSLQNRVDSEIAEDITSTGIALGATETVSRFGSANAEYIKGFSGLDNETGKKFAKGLKDISQYKINDDPAYSANNIKQQAGFSAEIAATSKDNAEAIINRSKARTSRSDDLPQYGRNHNVVDRVQLLNGEIIEGTQTQMKFVDDPNQLLDRIAREDGKFERYRGVKLELPSEQIDGAEQYCRDKASELRLQADKIMKNKPERADQFRREADNYDQLAGNIKDSGLTTEEAIFYRKHPEIATALDIARTSHRAGMEGAKYGAIIGCSISLFQNGLSAIQGKQDISGAAKSLAIDTAKAGAFGYATAYAGSAVKGAMQQSGKQFFRSLSTTNAPALVVNVCLSLGSSVTRFVKGEISEAQLLIEVGEKGSGMLSAGMMTALGQIAIPIPVVGAVIGGMIGYTLSSIFYQSALDAARGAEVSLEALKRTQIIQEAARSRIAEEQVMLDAFVRNEMPQLNQATQLLFESINTRSQSVEDFSISINKFATLLGKQLAFNTMDEFDSFMCSDNSLTL